MLVQMWFLKTLWLWFEVNVFRKWNRSILKCREWLQRVSSVSWSPHCFCLTFLSETALSSAWSVCFSVAGKGHRNCLFLIWVVQTGFIFYDSGNVLVWVYIDFWACSPSPITHSLFTIKFKHCIPPFSSAVLSSAPGQCGCSTRTEVLQRRQCQECLREVRQSQAQGCGCRQCWGASHRSLQSLLLFRCVFYKPDLLLPPDCGASAPCLFLTMRNTPEPCSTSNHMGYSRLPINISHSPALCWGKQVLLSFFSHVFFHCFLTSSFPPTTFSSFLLYWHISTTILLCLSFLEAFSFFSLFHC